MRIDFSLYLSSKNLQKRKLRSFLTIGGMAVGIGLIIFLVSLSFGLQRLIQNRITNVEALTVLDVSKGESTLLKLNQETVGQFEKLDNVKDVSPSVSLSGQVVKEGAVTDVAIYGIVPSFISLEGVKVRFGGNFSAPDAKEIIVTSTALNLIGFADFEQAIGQPITLKILVPTVREGSAEKDLVPKEEQVTVVGVIVNEEEDLSIGYIPLAFLESLGFVGEYSETKVKVSKEDLKEYNLARIKVSDQAKLPEVRKQIEAMGYQVDSVADTVGQIDRIFFVVEIVVGGFGAIALFVAAIGSLNTLTVSLLERTREIGIMKALGATSGDIYRLFLVEAIVIGLSGGILGVGVGIGAGEAVNAGINVLAQRLGGQSVDIFSTPVAFIAIIIFIVFLVSLVTGLYPAYRAAKINVLEALRYE